jgi:hypothetical protein
MPLAAGDHLALFFATSAMCASTFSTAFMSIKGLITAPGSNPEARWASVRYARGIIGAAVDDSPILTPHRC